MIGIEGNPQRFMGPSAKLSPKERGKGYKGIRFVHSLSFRLGIV